MLSQSTISGTTISGSFAAVPAAGGVTADTTPPTLAGPISLTAVTTSGAHAAWAAGADNVAVAGYEISVDTGTALWVDLGNVRSCDISGKSAGTYTVRVRDYDGATPRNYSTPITASLTIPATTTGTGGTITVPASRTAKFTGTQRVAVFSGSAPVTLKKGALDELYFVGDFTKILADAATTVAIVDPVASGATVLEAPVMQGSLGVVKIGALDTAAPKNTFTFRLTLVNGEQVDCTIVFTVLDDRTQVFGKDPDDKRFYALDFSADTALGVTSLASVQSPTVAGVTSLAAPTTQGNAAIVKIGGLDTAGANSCSLTATFANGEKLVRAIYFAQEDH